MSNLEKIYAVKRNILHDSRGWFLKVIDGEEDQNPFECEVYITSANPGESKGGHYHLKAHEWFTLLKGKALLTMIEVETNEKTEFALDATEPRTIYIPPGVAHRFYNSGDADFMLIAFTNLKYEPADTIVFEF